MTPLEINEKIAQIKGIQNEGIYVITTDTSETIKNIFTYKNWAENIDDAWELFEEMPMPAVRKLHDKSRFVYLCQLPIEIGKDPLYAAAETASVAICNLWIKWKETRK